ncbi:hypothetical protein JX265_001994 [Neoarthrinium moseri]|uniref:Oligopeptide transporter n=1 Tax=Neoarthrinium moseri TaxID=1658444 RepID=A0A9P9WW99_9PEZI|nr:hypothetical protein JX265_001994 [Neoarthrinium moseri]
MTSPEKLAIVPEDNLPVLDHGPSITEDKQTAVRSEKRSREDERAVAQQIPPGDDASLTDHLPRVTDHLPASVIIALFIGAAERFTYYALTTPWQNYMQNARNQATPGALGLGQSTATNISNAYLFFSFLCPMPFAILSDTWLGRYKTLLLSLGIYMIGCLVFFLTSIPKSLEAGAGVGGLASGMILIGLGQGGVKATFSPFLGDQYNQKDAPGVSTTKTGKRVIKDSALTLHYIYNLFYWATNVASLSSVPSTFLEKDFDFWVAYLFAACSLLISVGLLVIFRSKLVKVSPQGNRLPTAAKVILCAMRNGWKMNNAKPSHQLSVYGKVVSWDDEFVDELVMGLSTCRVLLSFAIFYLCINQMYNNLISQAGQMELHGVPNDMIQALAGIACVLLGPAIQWMNDAIAHRNLFFGPMLRITLAFVFCSGAMAFSAGLQNLIYDAPPCYNAPRACGFEGPNYINVWIQTPVYFILAAAEIFGFVTASEYSYRKAPRDMKSIIQAFVQLTAAFGSALGMAISPVAKDPYLVIMYSSLAAAMAICGMIFWLCFRSYDKAEKAASHMARSSGVVENQE